MVATEHENAKCGQIFDNGCAARRTARLKPTIAMRYSCDCKYDMESCCRVPLNAARPQLGQHHQLETFVPERHLCDRRVSESEVRRVCKRVQIDAQMIKQQECECAQREVERGCE